MQALALTPQSRMVTIASGGCNVLSYLTADPKEITAVDLNRAHVALTKLKLAAARHLPTHDAFYRFFGEADQKANLTAYRRFLSDRIDAETRAYWEGRDIFGRRRITLFSRDLYHHGLLGYFIGAAHFVARLYGVDPRNMIWAKTLDEQRGYFETVLAPLFDKRLVRWATSKKMSLYGLGIPPAQYEALASAGAGDMATVLRQRLERLACGFSMSENYFAWQAFGRSYASGAAGPLPPYLRGEHFDVIRARAGRVNVLNRSVTDYLEAQAARSSGRLRASRRAGLDDGRAAERALDPGHENRQARRPRRLPHGGGARPPARPRCRGAARTLDLRSGAQPDARRPRPLLHLRRLPPLRLQRMRAAAEAPSGELMDRVYRHQRHIYDLTRKYYLLGRTI